MRFVFCSTVAMIVAISTQCYYVSNVECSTTDGEALVPEIPDVTEKVGENLSEKSTEKSVEIPELVTTESANTKCAEKSKANKKKIGGIGLGVGIGVLVSAAVAVTVGLLVHKNNQSCAEKMGVSIERAVEEGIAGASFSPDKVPDEQGESTDATAGSEGDESPEEEQDDADEVEDAEDTEVADDADEVPEELPEADEPAFEETSEPADEE